MVDPSTSIDHIQIFDVVGRLHDLPVISNSNGIEINFAKLPDGVYWIAVISGEERSVEKVVKKSE